MKTGLIADIERSALHDGNGLRTTVFLKGCPLHCAWCHNPECISPAPETLLYPEKCIGCGMCEKGCYSGARVICGKEMSPEELVSEILIDRDYYDAGGGITFSGGEPMLQKEFLAKCIPLLKNEGIHIAIETSLWLYDPEILSRFDLVMADLKIWDSALHKQMTGVPNEPILEHFQMLDQLGVPILARTPIIPELNQNIPAISNFMLGLKNVIRYELLPYHPLGLTKAKALGLKQTVFTVPDKDMMKELSQYAFLR